MQMRREESHAGQDESKRQLHGSIQPRTAGSIWLHHGGRQGVLHSAPKAQHRWILMHQAEEGRLSRSQLMSACKTGNRPQHAAQRSAAQQISLTPRYTRKALRVSSGSLLGPYSASRLAASSLVRPLRVA